MRDMVRSLRKVTYVPVYNWMGWRAEVFDMDGHWIYSTKYYVSKEHSNLIGLLEQLVRKIYPNAIRA
jgi:hypothetical protein